MDDVSHVNVIPGHHTEGVIYYIIYLANFLVLKIKLQLVRIFIFTKLK